MTDLEGGLMLALMAIALIVICILYMKIAEAMRKEEEHIDWWEKEDYFEPRRTINLDHSYLMPLFYEDEDDKEKEDKEEDDEQDTSV